MALPLFTDYTRYRNENHLYYSFISVLNTYFACSVKITNSLKDCVCTKTEVLKWQHRKNSTID